MSAVSIKAKRVFYSSLLGNFGPSDPARHCPREYAEELEEDGLVEILSSPEPDPAPEPAKAPAKKASAKKPTSSK